MVSVCLVVPSPMYSRPGSISLTSKSRQLGKLETRERKWKKTILRLSLGFFFVQNYLSIIISISIPWNILYIYKISMPWNILYIYSKYYNALWKSEVFQSQKQNLFGKKINCLFQVILLKVNSALRLRKTAKTKHYIFLLDQKQFCVMT